MTSDGTRNSVVKIQTRLRAERTGVRILAEARDFYLLQYVQTVSAPPATAPYLMGTGIHSRGKVVRV